MIRWTTIMTLRVKLAFLGLAAQLLAAGPHIVDVTKIWDGAPHNAFTDLVRHKGIFYCVFREGARHVSPDGKLRVITSKDGRHWVSAALIESAAGDLRDAKITVTPENRLMLLGAAALHQPAPARHQTYVWFSDDGRKWSDAHPVGDPDYWLWRVNWYRGQAYGFAYRTAGDRDSGTLRLYRSKDGIQYETVVKDAGLKHFPNEHAMTFRSDGTAVALLRRDPPARGDATETTALIGTAQPPYTNWTWRDAGIRIGGPQTLALADGRCVAALRVYEPQQQTALAWFDVQKGSLDVFLTLPSGGDTSYPGLVWHQGMLWVSYYSSHEGRTAIYLARVKL